MIEFGDEFIMDIKPEEKRAQISNIETMDIASDCSTLSASEVDCQIGNDSTPPLFWKLKKAKVLIKKLPREVLAKYDLSSKNITWLSQPSRTSGRLKTKHIPSGRYLALHKNKPLAAVINKQRRGDKKTNKAIKHAKRVNLKDISVKKQTSASTHKPKTSIGTSFMPNFTNEIPRIKKQLPITSLGNKRYPPQTTLRHKNEVAKGKVIYNVVASPTATNTPVGNLTNTNTFNHTRSLHERIAARITNEAFEASLPILPDVVITRYDLPPSSRSQASYNACNVSNTVPTAIIRNRLHNSNATTEPFNSSLPNIYPHRNIQPKVYPAFLTPANLLNKTQRRSLPSSTHGSGLNEGLGRIHHSTPKQFTIEAFKKPYEKPVDKPNPVDTSKAFDIPQPTVEISPLKRPLPDSNISNNPERLKVNEIPARHDKGTSIDSDSDLEQIDAEEHIEREVIKRIIYHEKSVQTKFTCNGSIVGLIDSDEFNLNCFYCYDIFPLHKWREFKEHIKTEHHVEERANLTDSSDVENDSEQVQNNEENVLKPIPSKSNDTRKVAEEENITTKAGNNTKQNNKKLPLEPRLVAKKSTKMGSEQDIFFASTPKTVAKSTKTTTSQSRTSKKTSSKLSDVEFKNNHSNEIVNIDSDDCGLDLDNGNKTSKKNLQAEKNTKKKPIPIDKVSKAVEPKIILPTLPHITIKKVDSSLSKENTSTSSLDSLTSSTGKFIKVSSKTNIQKVIKNLPKPSANQLSENGQAAKPRYFVVKKIIKLPTNDTATDLNIPKGTVLTKMMDQEKVEDSVPKPTSGLGVMDFNIPRGTTLKKLKQETRKSNTEKSGKIEDSMAKPTNGIGILFGITNSTVVIEFLLKLKSFPELWRSQLKNLDLVEYNNCVKKLCQHLNNRFNLRMTEFEMRLSIQRVKDWYYLMLQSIEEHNKDPNNTTPYEHRFPIYFKILSKFLTPEAIAETSPFLNEVLNKTSFAAKTNDESLIEKSSEEATSDRPNSKHDSQDLEMNTDSLIEFDADTLYDQESSDDEVLETFDESNLLGKTGKKSTTSVGRQKRRYTKIYRASFECEICRKLFKRNCDLKRHAVLHLPPQFECSHCGQKFYHKYWAEKCTHVKSKNYPRYKRIDKASGEKRIWPKKIFQSGMICEICGNSYRSIGSLNTHKRDKHFNQKFRCVVCNFTALSNWLIERHQRKRHIVEPGLPEDVARKSRPRTTTETKTTFSNEARQAFDWRREMRKTMKPGEKFFGCCRCKIVFNTRKEKIFHNKIEHPITENTVICLLCLPNRLLLSNSNALRRHYIVIHKVPWYEIDGLVKCTKPIFSFLNKEEIELLKTSENYKELLDELLRDKKLRLPENVKIYEGEDEEAVENLKQEEEVESMQEENIYIDGIVDHSENDISANKQSDNASIQEHDYSEEQVISESFDDFQVVIDKTDDESEVFSQQSCEEADIPLTDDMESNENTMQPYMQNDEGHEQNVVEEYVEYELVEESVVVEEYIEEIMGEGEEHFV